MVPVAPSCLATDQRGVARPQRSACDVGAVEMEPPKPPEQPSGGTPPPGGTTATLDTTKPLVKFLLRVQRLRRILKKGYVVNFSTNEPGSATVDLFAEGKDAKGAAVRRKRVAHGAIKYTTAGKERVVAKFTKKAKRAFAKRRKLRLLVVLTVKDQAGNTTKLQKRVTFKR
jgi:hypothetical protein